GDPVSLRAVRIIVRIIGLCVLASACASSRPIAPANFLEALSSTPRLPPKGRIQDQAAAPIIPLITNNPARAVDLLIHAITSDTPLEQPILDYWPRMTVGDVALIAVLDLFQDSTGATTTPP